MSTCLDILKRIHASSTLVVVIVFFSLLTDSLLLTLVDPILPDIIRRINNATGVDGGQTVSEDINNNGMYGYLVAAKGATQFVCSPFVGILVVRFGFRLPMIFGSLTLMLSTVAFAFGSNYIFLFVTRMLQGAASSVTAVTGMGLLAATFTCDDERGRIMGIAIAGISMGIIAGPVYGSVLYQFFGQAVPFLTVAGMIFFTVVLQICGFKNDSGVKGESITTMIRLFCDPYILVVAGNVFLLNLDVSVILAFLPLRLIDLADPDTWQLGIVVLPTSIGYLLAGMIFPRLVKYIPRWIIAIVGLMISTGTLVALAFCYTFMAMIIVTTFLGIALGMVSTSMVPLFAHIVDLRHSGVYGNVYAISDMAVCLAMFVGPLIGGPIVYTFGFEWLVCGVALLNFCFAQFSCLLRRIPSHEIPVETLERKEKEPLIKSTTIPNGPGRATLSYRSHIAASLPTPRYLEYMSSIEDLRTSARTAYIDSV